MIPLRPQTELHGILQALDTGGGALAPQIDDLYTLYRHARMTAVVSALEIGTGWSTLVLAMALDENRRSMIHSARHPGPWRLHSIDADPEWMDVAKGRIPRDLQPVIDWTVADVVPHSHNGQSCHRFASWPACAPDLIYLDGPDPDQAANVRGQSPDEHGLPMSADLLLIEPHLWPGTTVIVDGRTANARFLARNLTRSWQVWEDPFGDRTWLQLVEPPLGPHHREHLDCRLSAATAMREGGINAPWGRVG